MWTVWPLSVFPGLYFLCVLPGKKDDKLIISGQNVWYVVLRMAKGMLCLVLPIRFGMNPFNFAILSVSSFTSPPSCNFEFRKLNIPIYPAIIRIHEPQNISTHTQIARPSAKISLQACVIVLGSGDVATVLQHVSMPAISNSECSSRWFFIPGASINAGHICVYQSGKSACSVSSASKVIDYTFFYLYINWDFHWCLTFFMLRCGENFTYADNLLILLNNIFTDWYHHE